MGDWSAHEQVLEQFVGFGMAIWDELVALASPNSEFLLRPKFSMKKVSNVITNLSTELSGESALTLILFDLFLLSAPVPFISSRIGPVFHPLVRPRFMHEKALGGGCHPQGEVAT